MGYLSWYLITVTHLWMSIVDTVSLVCGRIEYIVFIDFSVTMHVAVLGNALILVLIHDKLTLYIIYPLPWIIH